MSLLDEKDTVKIGSTLDSIATRKDGSIKMVFESQEMNPEQGLNLFSMRNKYGLLFFIPEGVKEVVVPELPKKRFKEEKSYSQRLRHALYILWKQLGAKGDSEDFYNYHMEKFIEQVKEKLEKRS